MSANLLDQLRDAVARYVVLPGPEYYDAVTLWIAASNVQPAWQHAPRLVLYSPEKRCGKSRLMDIICATCYRPVITVNISVAALVHALSEDPPTLLVDEADTIFGAKTKDTHEDLRGILNAGHQRNRPYIRHNVKTKENDECPTFAFAALAGIGEMPDTIMDRAVVVQMRRRAPDEKVAPFRSRDEAPLRGIGNDVAEWLRECIDDLAAAEPHMPVEDRAADTWEPLVAVADLAGGDWPSRARAACLLLTSEDPASASLGIRLLSDIRTVFGSDEKVYTDDLIGRLAKLDESPWGSWKGLWIGPREVAELLRPYGVTSGPVKIGGHVQKGYRRDGLHDAWTRYLPEVTGTEVTRVTRQVNGLGGVTGNLSIRYPVTPDNGTASTVTPVTEVTGNPDGNAFGQGEAPAA